jgi:hypothetical protein
VVDYTTASTGGQYSPKNVGAAWIERGGGGWIKMLDGWFFLRGGNLGKLVGAAGGRPLDAITSATLPNHRAHHNTWNLLDSTGAPVAAGAYQLVLEVTDRNNASRSIVIPFNLGSAPETMNPAGDQYFSGITISVQ